MKLKYLLGLSLGLSLGAAAASETIHTGSFWTNGVSENGGWYDAEKNRIENDIDDNLCYAASAANLIAWWQNDKVGSMLTSGAPKQHEDIWQTFVKQNQLPEEGGETLSVVNWWLTGVYMPTTDEEWKRHYTEREAWDDDSLPISLPSNLDKFAGYYYDRYGLNQEKLSDFLIDLTSDETLITEVDFADILRGGCGITLAIETTYGEEDGETSGHAITLWAVEYDENGRLIKIWVTDSDDEEVKIVEVPVEVDEENGKIWLKGSYYVACDYYISCAYVIDARASFKWSDLTMKAYVRQQVNPTTHNGREGVTLLPEVYMNEEPAEGGTLEAILEAVDYGELNDREAAAVAGASSAVTGAALSGDMERQLQAIRNRAVMANSGDDTVAADGKSGAPEQSDRFFSWINAEGNRAEQHADGTAAGYALSSWGGTVGAGMSVNNQLTLGLAVTAMYGDLKSDGPDRLEGDMDTTYLSAFARYQHGTWCHNFIGSVGTMEADFTRSAMGYTNNGDTDGTTFGLMYELSREYTLNDWGNISPLFNISYRHAAVDGYRERGTDAALNVGKQNLDTVTAALGARYTAEVGQQTLNRSCAVEARALVKCDFGDTHANTSVGFADYATRADIESADKGAMGMELGAGISVPVGFGCIFADGAVELRPDYTNFNAAAGYRIQF